MKNHSTILGIETSCDETAAAVVQDGTKILSNVVATSEKLHQKTGGIVPEIAAREQIKYIIPVVRKALVQAFGAPNINKVDALAVTQSPGLIGSLIVGVETAKTLSFVHQKPLVPVNHLFAHLYANWLEEKAPPKFPALGLIVSGGHTELLLIRGHQKFKWIGGTRDDAAGEAFDKAAKMLNLGYPGGPIIERLSRKGNPQAFNFPRPMIDNESFEFSFSGLKTALYYLIKQKPDLLSNAQTIHNLAASFQEAIVDVLVDKTIRAAKHFKVKSIILGGGVAANRQLRKRLQMQSPLPVHFPPINLSTDNAATTASCAYFNYQPQDIFEVSADPNLQFRKQTF